MHTIANITNGLRWAALLLGCGAALPLSAAERSASVPDTTAQRVVACTACHGSRAAPGAPASGRYFPPISGKPAGYLYNQLVNFREGRRQSPMMTYMVDYLPDAFLHEIADYFAAEHLAPPAPARAAAPQAVLERGRQLVTSGDPGLRVPACMACHGERLTGVAPAIPGLLGLPPDYINAQLGAWRNKGRRAHAPDCMAEITARLSPADVSAISSWLSTQAAAPDARPATAITRPLPLACGSAPD